MVSICLVGLGVMGKNLALNLATYNKVHVQNRTASKIKELEGLSPNIIGHLSLKDLVERTDSVRIIFLEITAGSLIDEFLEEFKGLLSKDDIVIDCGNSDYKDTKRRRSISEFNFVGMGVSGGAVGARYGPSMMVGCKKEIYEILYPFLEKIAARSEYPCCRYLGEDGAGHFVKTVHNGIEYSEMQLLQEIYNISLKVDFGLDKFFRKLMEGRTEGYLVDICNKILKKRNEKGLVLDQILDRSEQKGTGKMCIMASLETGVSIGTISEAVFSRFLSNRKDERVLFSKEFESRLKKDVMENKLGFLQGNCCKVSNSNIAIESPNENGTESLHSLIEKAFYLCKAVSYIQGFQLMKKQREINSWSFSFKDVCEVWRNGCILRCKFLENLKNVDDDLATSKIFLDVCSECYESLVELCILTARNGIYTPVFNNCLSWINGMRMGEKNGNLIQAMRDYFGMHGVILDSGESVNICWD